MAYPLLYIGLLPSCVKHLSELRDDFCFYGILRALLWESLPGMATVVVATGKCSHNLHRRGDLGDNTSRNLSINNFLQLWRAMAGLMLRSRLYSVFNIQNVDKIN